jgi:cell fate regulator YaaT (PSP1 superfamily)
MTSSSPTPDNGSDQPRPQEDREPTERDDVAAEAAADEGAVDEPSGESFQTHISEPVGQTPAPEETAEEEGGAALVCVRYGRMNMLGLFRSKLEKVLPHARVVIKSDRGLEIGTALCPANKQMTYEGRPLRRMGSIRRLATHDDLMEEKHIKQTEDRERIYCAQRIKDLKLPMRLAAVEHLFGGDRIIFYFLSESRVDFRQLVKDLAQECQTRIEMRQIGVRDEARLLADYERCGQFVCCRTFIKEFAPVSMRMAKLQKATLDPSKISGRCGRLMCCLRYEFDTYEDLRKKLPKRNSFVMIEELGPGKVVGSDILTQLVKVDVRGQVQIVPVESITARNLTEKDIAEWQATVGRTMTASRDSRRGPGDRGRDRRDSRPREVDGRPRDVRRPAASPADRVVAATPEVGEEPVAPGESAPVEDQASAVVRSETPRQEGRRPDGPRADGEQRSPRRRGRRSRGRRGRSGEGGTGQPPRDGSPQGGGRDGGSSDSRTRDSSSSGRGDLGVPARVLQDLGVAPPGGSSAPSGEGGRRDGRGGESSRKRRRGHRGRRRSDHGSPGGHSADQGGSSGQTPPAQG